MFVLLCPFLLYLSVPHKRLSPRFVSQAMSKEKRHLLRSLLELVEQTTYLNKENQQLVTGRACWHGIVVLALKTLETWSPEDPHHAAPFLLQLVQTLINLVNDNPASCDECASSGIVPAIVCFSTPSHTPFTCSPFTFFHPHTIQARAFEASVLPAENDDTIESLRNMCLTLLINLAELDNRFITILTQDCRLFFPPRPTLPNMWSLFSTTMNNAADLAYERPFLEFLAATFCDAGQPAAAEASEEDRTERNVFASYCAILLALLTEGSPARQAIAAAAGAPVSALAALVREFLAFQASTGLLSRHSCDSFERVLRSLGAP